MDPMGLEQDRFASEQVDTPKPVGLGAEAGQPRGSVPVGIRSIVLGGSYLVAQTFPMLNDSPRIGPALTFRIYALCSLGALLVVWAEVSETKGSSLEEIEQRW